MATTQEDRLLAINTSLGKDFLLIDSVSGTEEMSKLYSFDVGLLHEEDEDGDVPTIVEASSLLGQGVTITIGQIDGTTRTISGIINKFSQGNRTTRFTSYSATVVPHVWLLTQKTQSRIFQNLSVPDILRQVFDGFEVSWLVQDVTDRRNYCVQYRESDFNFACRLMEEEGICFYFDHTGERHKMVVANTPQAHENCPSRHKIPYFFDVAPSQVDFATAINYWRSDYQLQTGKVTLWDYNFQLPTKKLDHDELSIVSAGPNKQLELYDHQGGYARKYDGISSSGSDQAGELATVEIDKERTVKARMESLDAGYRILTGKGDCSSMTSGYRFTLSSHPTSGENADYLITRVTHKAEQSPSYISDEEIDGAYSNSFSCIRIGAGYPPFRPRPETAKPIVHGSQTAFVVGPAGEEIFTDKYGRVKVQFHWDRSGRYDSGSSCWVRVGQTWAANKWGGMFIPRIGMEVIVDFLEGDPDQPIITGCVYNPGAMPPYTLPDEKTKSTIKSNSSKGGGGFNEIRFEDRRGDEQVFIHAQKNQDVRVKNDSLEYIGHDRHLIIENDQFEKVKKDKNIDVGGDHKEEVKGSISIKSGSDIDEKTGTKFALDAGTEIHLKSGTNLTLETGANLTLKVGGNFINISPGGIFIKGTMVMLNSGGAAGSGSGSNPDPPVQAKEADKAEPGKTIELPPPQSPPEKPDFKSPAALVLINAAQSGAAFCEICGR
jgi:type VI secretion system secreted protein VgrG